MPRPHSAMRKIREIIRLRFGEGLSMRAVSASLQIPLTTVTDHVSRARCAGLSWPLPEDLEDDEALRRGCSRRLSRSRLVQALTGRRSTTSSTARA